MSCSAERPGPELQAHEGTVPRGRDKGKLARERTSLPAVSRQSHGAVIFYINMT